LNRVTQERLFLAALLLPAVTATAALVAWPILQAGRISLHQLKLAQLMRPIEAPATLANYERGLGHPGFVASLEATAIFVGVGTALALLLGLVSALVLDRRFAGSALLRTVILSPWAIAPVVASLAWLFMCNESLGLANHLLLTLGLVDAPVPFLTSPAVAIWTVTLAATWKAFPFFTIVLLAGLQSIPSMLYDSAAVDGAGRLRRFRDVTLPGLRPFILIATLLSLLAAYRNVETILVMTGGGPARSTETLAVRVYTETFTFLSPGTGAAIGMMTVAIALLIALPFVRHLGGAADR
jgi:multiple sugar transport system permease protein